MSFWRAKTTHSGETNTPKIQDYGFGAEEHPLRPCAVAVAWLLDGTSLYLQRKRILNCGGTPTTLPYTGSLFLGGKTKEEERAGSWNRSCRRISRADPCKCQWTNATKRGTVPRLVLKTPGLLGLNLQTTEVLKPSTQTKQRHLRRFLMVSLGSASTSPLKFLLFFSVGTQQSKHVS